MKNSCSKYLQLILFKNSNLSIISNEIKNDPTSSRHNNLSKCKIPITNTPKPSLENLSTSQIRLFKFMKTYQVWVNRIYDTLQTLVDCKDVHRSYRASILHFFFVPCLVLTTFVFTFDKTPLAYKESCFYGIERLRCLFYFIFFSWKKCTCLHDVWVAI